ncbi:MAG: gluconate 2-dehydrogenase subunit 3 family protein [Acidobacteria bacterium]|nr:gluconate 2-dehydrogenase subunit 3 family protein [Acidobacteriota bacterium]MCA1651100.1 gluconate 2-dehydrogenase subunit 3 family protein [Acidobacteriota bacterium]
MALSNRRTALRTLAAGAVGAATSATWVESLSALASQQAHAHAAQAAVGAQKWTPRVLNAKQNAMVVVFTELIIPETDTPGAKAALVNRFIDAVLHAAPPADRAAFLRGLAWMNERSQTVYEKDFVSASVADRTALLATLAHEKNEAVEDRLGVEFFRAIKSMTIDGYYTSEIGLRRELGDNGQLFFAQFDGCDHPEHQG